MGDTGYGNAWPLSASRAAICWPRLVHSAMPRPLQPSAIVTPGAGSWMCGMKSRVMAMRPAHRYA